MGVESELWGEATSAVRSAVEQTCGSVWTRLAPGGAPTCWPGDGAKRTHSCAGPALFWAPTEIVQEPRQIAMMLATASACKGRKGR